MFRFHKAVTNLVDLGWRQLDAKFLSTKNKMPRKRSGERKNATFDKETIAEAVKTVRSGKSIRHTAKEFGLSKSTLQRYVDGTKDQEDLSNAKLTPNYASRRVFTEVLRITDGTDGGDSAVMTSSDEDTAGERSVVTATTEDTDEGVAVVMTTSEDAAGRLSVGTVTTEDTAGGRSVDTVTVEVPARGRAVFMVTTTEDTAGGRAAVTVADGGADGAASGGAEAGRQRVCLLSSLSSSRSSR
ncbi:hypothetical protein FOCC_FOCC013852 [Frankliniella occidentalis]|nr:hypothetical protein FOCC_FOCC013852 [Frankliniella occidentalis]